ncbi:Periplasmic binding protein-like domain-containing protein [Bifidobacterium hapali]|uniref:Periplasmic binding protein-like domain-containing protein n=1 Tax=Bifidobacterium hapali TaxID=1630172 RepID=A0A261FUV2_9BIFI|nr:LacI family DNA-binding transcriptional regulator [Bifidobacterium hapali]OZG62962.1 Periplasmic binding protein-like domain-containing protein [Bifidobacterium hapali]
MATLRDVATRAGVSASTVSYILRGDTRFQAETVARVRAAARELGYTANLSARILKAGRNGVIGVAVYALEAAQPMRLAAAINREAAQRGLRVIVQETANSRKGELQTLEQTTSQFCDGLIFSPAKVSAEEIKSHIGTKPMVWCEDFSDSPIFDSVVTPSFEGSRDAVRHLISVGCRRIGILGIGVRTSHDRNVTNESHEGNDCIEAESSVFVTDGNATFRTQRLRGYLAALNEASIVFDPTWAIDCAWNFEAAREATQQLANSSHVPIDGLFCMNDVLAIGASRGLADCGVHVPDDVAIIGFDGIRETAYTTPSISTVTLDYNDYARKALDLLAARIDGANNGAPAQRLVANYRIVQRESTMR